MKLFAELNNETHEITLEQTSEKVFAEIDGRTYEIEASEPEPNVYLLKYNHQILEIFVSPDKKPSEPFQVHVANHNFEIKISDPKRLRGTSAADGAIEGAAEIKTAMPGKVVRVLVEQGAEVQAGDGIIVVEAMKMQNEMKSPKDGIIKEIRFSEGETVNAGDVLAVIE
jgi:biotin carboxyl carrier protein